jgi:aryl-alcohol dehydrogenase-like predicted oxidoreductase
MDATFLITQKIMEGIENNHQSDHFTSLVGKMKSLWEKNETGLSRKHLRDGLHDSLKRLEMDYVDLLYCHRPDPSVPMEEIVWTMNHFIQRGQVLYWGTSEWTSEQIEEAFQVAERLKLIPPTMEQPEYNMFRREKVEKEFKRLYERYGLGLTIWSPLAFGILSGKYVNGIPEHSRLGTQSGLDERYQQRMKRVREDLLTTEVGKKKLEKVKKLMKIAEELGCTM